MDLQLAQHLSHAADAAYARHSDPVHKLGFERVQLFEGDRFTGYVASTDQVVVLCFRGTELKLQNSSTLWTTLQQWLTNLDYAQQKQGNYRIHRGFHRELSSIYDELPNVLREHGVQTKPFFVTGHSAGGALATLAARSLAEDGIAVDAAYVYSSPRVGDQEFSKSYPVPLYRFEYMSDVVPHLPFSPSMMQILDTVKEQFAPLIELFFPQVHEYRDTEYIHAGVQFFIDWEKQLLHSVAEEELLLRSMYEAIFGKLPSLPGRPVPQRLMGAARFLETCRRVAEQLSNGEIGFVENHLLQSFIDTWSQFTPST